MLTKVRCVTDLLELQLKLKQRKISMNHAIWHMYHIRANSTILQVDVNYLLSCMGICPKKNVLSILESAIYNKHYLYISDKWNKKSCRWNEIDRIVKINNVNHFKQIYNAIQKSPQPYVVLTPKLEVRTFSRSEFMQHLNRMIIYLSNHDFNKFNRFLTWFVFSIDKTFHLSYFSKE